MLYEHFTSYTCHRVIEREHSLVMTFEIYVCTYVKCALFRIRTAHVLSAQNKRTEAERETDTACGMINFKLAILEQRTTLSKLCNGTLDVA